MISRKKLTRIAAEGIAFRGLCPEDEIDEQAREVVSYVLANLEVAQEYFHSSDVKVVVRKAAEYGWGGM